MQRHALQAVLRELLPDLVDRERDVPRTVRRVDAHDALADTLRDPEVVVGPPSDFPGILEARGHDARRELLGRIRPNGARIHVRTRRNLRGGEPGRRCKDED